MIQENTVMVRFVLIRILLMIFIFLSTGSALSADQCNDCMRASNCQASYDYCALGCDTKRNDQDWYLSCTRDCRKSWERCNESALVNCGCNEPDSTGGETKGGDSTIGGPAGEH